MIRTKLPGEAEAEAAMQQRFGPLLERSDRLLALAIEVISGPELHVTRTRGIRQHVVIVVLGLYAKACKTFRGLLLTASMGMGEDSFILGRALFETALAIIWILQRGSIRRASVYVAYLKVVERRYFECLARTKGTKRMAMKGRLARARERVRQAETEFGVDLVRSLRNGWSGASLETTAGRLRGWGPIYQLFYRHGSRFEHSADLPDHVHLTNGVVQLKMVPSNEIIMDEILRITYGLMWAIVARVNERLGLGHEAALQNLR